MNGLYIRPNRDKIMAAPAQSTGGIKGIIAGKTKFLP